MLERSGFKFNIDATRRALAAVSVSLKFETISVFPTIIADSTHKSEAVDTMCRTLVDFKEQTGNALSLCISPDKELIREYRKQLEANGYALREIILVSRDSSFSLPEIEDELKVTIFQTHKAAAKRVMDAAKENGFVLITGDAENSRNTRKEIMRLLES
jgi:folylpolyglutamate synthase/dihydropteroate synthase